VAQRSRVGSIGHITELVHGRAVSKNLAVVQTPNQLPCLQPPAEGLAFVAIGDNASNNKPGHKATTLEIARGVGVVVVFAQYEG